ncbi:MAG: putative PEP-binding protein [Planctomycetota bacterium]|jgi:pyruvate,orthophosphate dikinase
MAKSNHWVYFFGGGDADGDGSMRELLGGKGAGLAEMTVIGLPVPGGFTITTEACAEFNNADGQWPAGLEKEVRVMLARLEKQCGKKLGGDKDPLLVSVRSGAAKSMPGMMETILNLGLNDKSVEGLAAASNNRRFSYDSYRRFIMMYGSTAMGIEREIFDEAFDGVKRDQAAARLGKGPDEKVLDTDLSAEELESVVEKFKTIYREHTGADFPQDPFEQLRGSINAVFNSWMFDKAVKYREVENITGLAGTAVNICQMVYGNMGDDCGTGVCFTRDPSTGEDTFYGDLLINAQGEDVVAGVRTPIPLATLGDKMPEVYEQLEAVRVMLEVHYQDMQDLEFTIERGKLYMLQCRSGKRSPTAAFKIAVDQASKGMLTPAAAKALVKKGYLPKKYEKPATKPIINKDDAIQRIEASDIERLFLPIIDPQVSAVDLEERCRGKGIGAVPGAACGEVVFSAERAEQEAEAGKTVILVRKETSPEDVGGMHAAVGILTATGGKTSHAAVVARGWGKCCIVGCEDLIVDYNAKTMSLNGTTLSEGSSITLDGGTGQIYEGTVPLERPEAPPEFDTLMSWCDKRRLLKVRTNADTPADSARAVELGAEGIGLCRTEHMFFDPSEPQRIRAMREMILSTTEEQRQRALDKLLPYQQKDFEGVFAAMDGKPVTIRLLDPPLHEFLPHHDNPEGQQAVVDDLNESAGANGAPITLEDVQRRVEQLHESNPMLGHRGCRLSITFPAILQMQVTAIVEAAVACQNRGIKVAPEIMIPLTIDPYELEILASWTREVADEILQERGAKLNYLVGTMIETPRAAIYGEPMGEVAQFFSFGTNDLTQTTMALSRDDAGRFLPVYIDEDKADIFAVDPFESIDDGVAFLVKMACVNAREANPGIKLGICGEHGGDPESIRFFAAAELDYVSCSPLRVPVARLASAQAQIELEEFTFSIEIDEDDLEPAEPAKKKAAKKKAAKKKKAKKKAAKKAKKKVAKKKAAKKKTAKKKKAKKKATKKKAAAKKSKAKKAKKKKR